MEERRVKQQGVTLIQMLFALGLLALLTQFGATSYSTMSNELQQQAAAKALAQALRAARNEALLRNQEVTLQAKEGGWTYGWQLLSEHSDTPLLREYSASGKVRIVGNQPVAQRVRFSGLGVPLKGGNAFLSGALHICGAPGQEEIYQIVLSRTGRVSLNHGTPTRPLCPGSVN